MRERVAAAVVGILRCGLGAGAKTPRSMRTAELTLLLSVCDAAQAADLQLAGARARALARVRPDLPTGWALLALIQATQASENADERLRMAARANAGRAARIAPNSELTRLATIFALGETNTAVLPELEAALRDFPDDPELLLQWSGTLFNAGYVRASVAPALQATRSDPTSLRSRDVVVRRLAAAGRLAEAYNAQAENERLWPGHPQVVEQRARLHAMSRSVGTLENTRRNKAVRMPVPVIARPHDAYSAAQRAELLGHRAAALAWLARAPVGVQAYQQWSVLFWPNMAGLRTEPAFFAKMAELGLVRIWIARGRWPDFCAQPALKYRCATEAARLGLLT